jgi:hypothetical protein
MQLLETMSTEELLSLILYYLRLVRGYIIRILRALREGVVLPVAESVTETLEIVLETAIKLMVG